ncbi:unnamed protein product [Notodromas monacha]|uniref:Uncharacterized protein n=1 Tax=Notodromas monacha TaxID=399045 RepID=A0A7R9BZ20_9CRUS|nr:unnamed protein product [Notodromas monacha]CAG0923458.1 unnamed protein product [Notodromas monacha]
MISKPELRSSRDKEMLTDIPNDDDNYSIRVLRLENQLDANDPLLLMMKADCGRVQGRALLEDVGVLLLPGEACNTEANMGPVADDGTDQVTASAAEASAVEQRVDLFCRPLLLNAEQRDGNESSTVSDCDDTIRRLSLPAAVTVISESSSLARGDGHESTVPRQQHVVVSGAGSGGCAGGSSSRRRLLTQPASEIKFQSVSGSPVSQATEDSVLLTRQVFFSRPWIRKLTNTKIRDTKQTTCLLPRDADWTSTRSSGCRQRRPTDNVVKPSSSRRHLARNRKLTGGGSVMMVTDSVSAGEEAVTYTMTTVGKSSAKAAVGSPSAPLQRRRHHHHHHLHLHHHHRRRGRGDSSQELRDGRNNKSRKTSTQIPVRSQDPGALIRVEGSTCVLTTPPPCPMASCRNNAAPAESNKRREKSRRRAAAKPPVTPPPPPPTPSRIALLKGAVAAATTIPAAAAPAFEGAGDRSSKPAAVLLLAAAQPGFHPRTKLSPPAAGVSTSAIPVLRSSLGRPTMTSPTHTPVNRRIKCTKVEEAAAATTTTTPPIGDCIPDEDPINGKVSPGSAAILPGSKSCSYVGSSRHRVSDPAPLSGDIHTSLQEGRPGPAAGGRGKKRHQNEVEAASISKWEAVAALKRYDLKCSHDPTLQSSRLPAGLWQQTQDPADSAGIKDRHTRRQWCAGRQRLVLRRRRPLRLQRVDHLDGLVDLVVAHVVAEVCRVDAVLLLDVGGRRDDGRDRLGQDVGQIHGFALIIIIAAAFRLRRDLSLVLLHFFLAAACDFRLSDSNNSTVLVNFAVLCRVALGQDVDHLEVDEVRRAVVAALVDRLVHHHFRAVDDLRSLGKSVGWRNPKRLPGLKGRRNGRKRLKPNPLWGRSSSSSSSSSPSPISVSMASSDATDGILSAGGCLVIMPVNKLEISSSNTCMRPVSRKRRKMSKGGENTVAALTDISQSQNSRLNSPKMSESEGRVTDGRRTGGTKSKSASLSVDSGSFTRLSTSSLPPPNMDDDESSSAANTEGRRCWNRLGNSGGVRMNGMRKMRTRGNTN